MGWPRWDKNANYVKECTILEHKMGPTKAILEPNKAPAGKPLLVVPPFSIGGDHFSLEIYSILRVA